ncbi:PREDICTED: CBL-interacting serine/threonine-protein kinase 23-like isoform X3 [Nelumbo nucifera]|uniref:CBL-interacting serine/threonine-protein kinase 23-like isoform X3 n=1 Tax=Nelumbo nucifera TaxID=4432 RepID=A0A1U7ZUY8_NELNU|nr:PREDICTED: CBL-interacting serine/threonine-protein kinase 23-like isoform X3 [Nelumbo nucifera]
MKQLNRVGKYEFGSVLGRGSFGKVYLARDVETGEKRAIKVLNKDRVVKEKMTDQIKREISIMKLVRHPNVVHLFEVMASKTKIYFVMEYVTGGELLTKVSKQGKLREDEARKYFQQLISAVDYCHSKGVYHRDLKLENLLLDEDCNLKISDFGLSASPQQIREDGLLYTTCGTPNYVAPEVIDDRGYDGAKADLWSCGVVLFVLMAGYLPFDEPSLSNLYNKICKADFTCPYWFSSEARMLINRILEPDPEKRISISHVLECSWFKKGYKPVRFEDQKAVVSSETDLLFSNSSKEKGISMKIKLDFECFEDLGLNHTRRGGKREMRFALRCSASEIMEKMEESAKPLGFNVKRLDYMMQLEGCDMGQRGLLSICTEVFEVSPSLFVVEMKKARGDTLEFDKFYESYSTALRARSLEFGVQK